MDFEWDAAKDLSNFVKHGVRFNEALDCFSDPQGFVLEDVRHSKLEQRFYWVGKDVFGRILTVGFTHRAGIIRIIGAAEWREFRKKYYEKAGDQ
jgi:uncharacterized DUF497 family protein